MKSFTEYQNPSLAVDLVVFGYHENELYALLLNRNTEPFKDKWTLPGAFLQMDERFQDTCKRILETKLGMSNLYMEQLYSFDRLERGSARQGSLGRLLCHRKPAEVSNNCRKNG